MVDSNLGLGIVLVAFVLLIPQGLLPVVRNLLMRFPELVTKVFRTKIVEAKAGKPADPAREALAGEVRP